MMKLCTRVVVLVLVGAVGLSVQTAMAAKSSSGAKSKGSTSALTAAQKAVDAKDYRGALRKLEKLNRSDPENADVLNLLGYSHRKLGKLDEAFDYYHQALAVDPKHRGANEYLGELYLELDQLDEAEHRLAQLKKSCFFGCEERRDLEEAIKEYKASNGAD